MGVEDCPEDAENVEGQPELDGVVHGLAEQQTSQLTNNGGGSSLGNKEAGEFWWAFVEWRRPFILSAAILEYNERNFFFG